MNFDSVSKLSETQLNNELIEYNLNIFGNKETKQNILLIAFGNNTKYWISHNKSNIKIPFDIIKLILSFHPKPFKFTIYNPSLIEKNIIKFSKHLNSIKCIKSHNNYITIACHNNTICNFGSFNIKIIKRTSVMYIGLLSDFSRINENESCNAMERTGVTVFWYHSNAIRHYNNETRINEINCGLKYYSNDVITVKRK